VVPPRGRAVPGLTLTRHGRDRNPGLDSPGARWRYAARHDLAARGAAALALGGSAMSSASEFAAYNAGVAGGVYLGSSPEEHAAYMSGLSAGRSGGGGAGGGVGIVALPFLLLAMIPAITIGTCLFPLAGILTLVGTSLIAGLLPDNVGFLVVLVVVLLPGIFMFVFALKLENRLEHYRAYRNIRCGARMLAVGFVAHVFAFAFNGAGTFARGTTVLDRISFIHVVIVLAAMVGGYFMSRALDRRMGVQGFKRRFGLARVEGMVAPG
jgi:hypothetical protein